MIKVRINGLDRVDRALAGLDRAVRRGVYNAINKSGTAGRKEAIERIARATGISRKVVRGGFHKPKRAGFKRSAYIATASSEGIDIEEYRYTLERVGYGRNATRGRIRVGWVVGGTKIAAGFINPFGRARRGLRTRDGSGRDLPGLDSAIGLSIAAALKAMDERPVEQTVTQAFLRHVEPDVERQLRRIAG